MLIKILLSEYLDISNLKIGNLCLVYSRLHTIMNVQSNLNMSYTINVIKHLCQTLITLKRFSEHFSKFNQATLLNYKLNKEIHQNNQGDKKTKYNLIQ